MTAKTGLGGLNGRWWPLSAVDYAMSMDSPISKDLFCDFMRQIRAGETTVKASPCMAQVFVSSCSTNYSTSEPHNALPRFVTFSGVIFTVAFSSRFYMHPDGFKCSERCHNKYMSQCQVFLKATFVLRVFCVLTLTTRFL